MSLMSWLTEEENLALSAFQQAAAHPLLPAIRAKATAAQQQIDAAQAEVNQINPWLNLAATVIPGAGPIIAGAELLINGAAALLDTGDYANAAPADGPSAATAEDTL